MNDLPLEFVVDWERRAQEAESKIDSLRSYARLYPLDLLKPAEIQHDLLAIASGNEPPSSKLEPQK